MERVLLSNNHNILYFSLRFEASDPSKILFCQNCPLSQNACYILERSVPNRIVSRINLCDITNENINANCGGISELLK